MRLHLNTLLLVILFSGFSVILKAEHAFSKTDQMNTFQSQSKEGWLKQFRRSNPFSFSFSNYFRSSAALSSTASSQPFTPSPQLFSRDGICLYGSISALVPQIRAEEIPDEFSETFGSFRDLTVSAYPTLLAYIPDAPANTKAVFTLTNAENDNQIYTTEFELIGRAGIVGITVPDSVEPLSEEQTYHWQITVKCDAQNPWHNQDIVIGRLITRVPYPSFVPSDLREKAASLAQQGIWQDAISILALHRHPWSHSPSIEQDWADLLESVGLSEFSRTPIIQIISE